MQQLHRQEEAAKHTIADIEGRYEKEADKRAEEIVLRILR